MKIALCGYNFEETALTFSNNLRRERRNYEKYILELLRR